MIRTRCSHIEKSSAGKQCKKVFRARSDSHKLCRQHYRLEFDLPRPIGSRKKSENKYRRVKSRRRTIQVKKESNQPIKGKKKGNQNAQSYND